MGWQHENTGNKEQFWQWLTGQRARFNITELISIEPVTIEQPRLQCVQEHLNMNQDPSWPHIFWTFSRERSGEIGEELKQIAQSNPSSSSPRIHHHSLLCSKTNRKEKQNVLLSKAKQGTRTQHAGTCMI